MGMGNGFTPDLGEAPKASSYVPAWHVTAHPAQSPQEGKISVKFDRSSLLGCKTAPLIEIVKTYGGV